MKPGDGRRWQGGEGYMHVVPKGPPGNMCYSSRREGILQDTSVQCAQEPLRTRNHG